VHQRTSAGTNRTNHLLKRHLADELQAVTYPTVVVVVVMAISNTRQFGLLLWKNWLLQKRAKVLTVFIVVIPPLFSFILFCIRGLIASTPHLTPTIWDSVLADTTFPPNLQLPNQVPQAYRYWQLAYAPQDLQRVRLLVGDAVQLLNGPDTNTMPNSPNNIPKITNGPGASGGPGSGSQVTGVRVGQGKRMRPYVTIGLSSYLSVPSY